MVLTELLASIMVCRKIFQIRVPKAITSVVAVFSSAMNRLPNSQVVEVNITGCISQVHAQWVSFDAGILRPSVTRLSEQFEHSAGQSHWNSVVFLSYSTRGTPFWAHLVVQLRHRSAHDLYFVFRDRRQDFSPVARAGKLRRVQDPSSKNRNPHSQKSPQI